MGCGAPLNLGVSTLVRPTHLLLCILLSGVPFGCSRKESHEDQKTPTLTGEAAPTHGALIAAALTLDARLPRAVLLARTALDRRLTQDEQEELERFLLLGQNERTWAAFGLGAHYKRLDSPPIEPLITAVASWFLDRTPPSPKELQAAAWALGSSGAELAEATLRGWLSPPPDQEAAPLILAGALGLGAFADRRGLLSERTQAALLDAAGREKNGVLLYPLGRLGRLSPAVSSRLLEVCGDLLVHKGAESRRPILFALGSSGSGAAEPLGQVLLSSEYTEGERSAAAQALARLGSEGQQVLDRTTRDLLDRGLPTTETSTLWAPLVSALDGLSDAPQSRKALRQIATVVLPERESTERAALRRRRRRAGSRRIARTVGSGYPHTALTATTTLLARSLEAVWHPCTQMKSHERFPLVPVARAESMQNQQRQLAARQHRLGLRAEEELAEGMEDLVDLVLDFIEEEMS